MRTYICDPDKNKECKKTGCQDYCFHTLNKEFAREDLISLEEAIQHCEEVAKEQDKLATRYEDASGYSRSHIESLKTNESIKCRKCANEYRQLVEWLKKLGDYENGIERIKEQISNFKGLEEWTEANAMEYALELLGVYKGEEVYHIKMGAVKDDRKTGDS